MKPAPVIGAPATQRAATAGGVADGDQLGPLEFEIAEDVAEQIPPFIAKYNTRSLHSSLGYLSPEQYEKQHARPPVKDAA